MTYRVLILEDQPDGLALLKSAASRTFSAPVFVVAATLVDAFALLKPPVSPLSPGSFAASSATTRAPSFDYALVDLRLPDGLSIEWLQAFKTTHPQTPAVVTSLYDDDELVFAALRAGADGYLLKGDGVDNLEQSLAKILQGEPPISPAIARKLMQQFRGSALSSAVTSTVTSTVTSEATKHEPIDLTDAAAGLPMAQAGAPAWDAPRLTARELDVLGLIGSGLMIKQVAGQLAISPHTVNDNIKAIYKKLGIHSRVQAAIEAARRGLVASP